MTWTDALDRGEWPAVGPSYVLERRGDQVALSMPHPWPMSLRPPDMRQLGRLLTTIADQIDQPEQGIEIPAFLRRQSEQRLVPRFDERPHIATALRSLAQILPHHSALLFDAAGELDRLNTIVAAGE